MNISDFAKRHRLRVTGDECNDPIIEGKRGHLWFKDAQLCLMVIDGAPAKRSSWESLGGHLWLGDISPDANGRGVQDVRIDGIPLENAEAAIKMIHARPKRVLTAEEHKALLARLPKGGVGRRKRPSPGLETLLEAPPPPEAA